MIFGTSVARASPDGHPQGHTGELLWEPSRTSLQCERDIEVWLCVTSHSHCVVSWYRPAGAERERSHHDTQYRERLTEI